MIVVAIKINATEIILLSIPKRILVVLLLIQSCAAEAAGKLYVITSVLIPRVRYPDQFMPWTEEQLDTLDVTIRAGARRILDKVCSYTNFVLHHPELDNVLSLVESVQSAKHQTL